MAESTTSPFSIEQAITAYWRLRQFGQNGVMARLSVEARSVDWSVEHRRALRAILHPYDEQPAPSNWLCTAAIGQEQS